MGYKKYSDINMAIEMVDKIRRGEISNRNTAYRELMQISNEWRGESVGYDAQDLIDENYSDLKYGN